MGHSHICSHLVTTVATCQPHEENLSQVVSKISGAFYVPPGGFHVSIDWSNVLTAAGFRLRSPPVNVPPACALAFWSFKYNVYTPSRNWHCRSTSQWLCWNSFVIAGSQKGHMLTAPSSSQPWRPTVTFWFFRPSCRLSLWVLPSASFGPSSRPPSFVQAPSVGDQRFAFAP